MKRIKKVEYVEGYKLKLTFNDKKQKIVDLQKYKNMGPETVFYPFRDLKFFKSVIVDKETETIVWPNGVDLCPDALYMMGKDVKDIQTKSSEKRKNSKQSSASEKPHTRIAAKSN